MKFKLLNVIFHFHVTMQLFILQANTFCSYLLSQVFKQTRSFCLATLPLFEDSPHHVFIENLLQVIPLPVANSNSIRPNY